MGCERQYGLFILISPNQRAPANIWPHRPELTRERSICFFYLKSNVFSSITQQTLDLQICLFYTFLFKMYMPTKKIFMLKGYKIM